RSTIWLLAPPRTPRRTRLRRRTLLRTSGAKISTIWGFVIWVWGGGAEGKGRGPQ
ncbi:MAG: hypothetical protein BJ554DRAFT_7725, partial [Olpidium bornovanus]